MASIHFVGGEKGGVGKSVAARVLAQYLIEREIPFLGFDTDRFAWLVTHGLVQPLEAEGRRLGC